MVQWPAPGQAMPSIRHILPHAAAARLPVPPSCPNAPRWQGPRDAGQQCGKSAVRWQGPNRGGRWFRIPVMSMLMATRGAVPGVAPESLTRRWWSTAARRTGDHATVSWCRAAMRANPRRFEAAPVLGELAGRAQADAPDAVAGDAQRGRGRRCSRGTGAVRRSAELRHVPGDDQVEAATRPDLLVEAANLAAQFLGLAWM